MKTTLFALAWLFSFGVQAQNSQRSTPQEVRGSGQIVKEIKTVSPFTEIQTQQFPASITVEVGGNESSVAVSIDDNLRPYLRIDQQSGILKFSFVGQSGKPFPIGKSAVSVTVRTPQLIGFRHESNGDVLIQGLSGEWFDLANKDNGKVRLRGKVTNFNVVNIANGDVRADELLTQNANVVLKDNATLRVNAQAIKEINSGQGQIINVARRAK